MEKLLVICGPTATGKTQVAVSLAKQFNGELISADSRQVYRGMDIGTGKDRDKIDVPIWLLDVVNPDEEFSVSHWTKLANEALADIWSRGKLPIVVGGTGLYIQALLHPPETMNIPPDKNLREQLQHESVESLQQMMGSIMLQAMNQSDRNNPRRLIRKIEISRIKKTHAQPSRIIDSFMIGLTASLSELYARIDARVDERLQQGMAGEVDALIKTYGREIPAMSGLGYRSLPHWKQDEHKYAKRQLTWFKKQSDIHWFDVTKKTSISDVTSTVLAWYTEVVNEQKN